MKEQRKAADGAYYLAHRDEILAKKRLYHASRKEHQQVYRQINKAKRCAYNAENREKIRQQSAARYALRRDELQARYLANRAEKIAYQAAQYAAKSEVARARQSAYYAAHREEALARQKAYAVLHRAEVYARNAARRARKRNAPVNDFTAAQWRAMQEHYKYCCAYCGAYCQGKMTQDHIAPLSRGGSHTLSNIVPACQFCNFHKHTGPVLSAVQPLLLVAL